MLFSFSKNHTYLGSHYTVDHFFWLISFSSFSPNQIWNCPDGGITENVTEALTDLIGHGKKVGIIQWHPSAENVMASAGFDLKVIVWDVGKASPVHVISCHDDVINALVWNFDGSLLATSSKDKKARVIDPRKTDDHVVNVSLSHSWC